MTTDLRDRFDDLLAGVPDHVTADPRTAWRAGSRRRTRRRVVVAASALAVAAVLLGGVTAGVKMSGPEPAGTEKVPWWTVSGHPARIDKPFTETDFTGSPNGVAGVVGRADGWYAVTATGDLLRLTGATDTLFLPSISPDGTRVTAVGGSHVQQFFVDAAEESVSGTVGDVDLAGTGYVLGEHTQSFWSPDSFDLAVPVTYARDPDVLAVLAGHNSSATPVLAPEGVDDPILVGWLTQEDVTDGGSTLVRQELGWLDWNHMQDPGIGPLLRVPQLLVTSAQGGDVLRTVPLRSGRLDGETVVTATLSPYGDGRLAVTTTERVLVFAADGQLATEPDRPPGGLVADCPASWSRSGPAWPVSGTSDDAVLVHAAGAPVVQADPRTEIGCSVWAAQALDGSVNEGISGLVFGSNSSWLAWHWREIGISLGMALAGAGLYLWWRRRSRLARSDS